MKTHKDLNVWQESMNLVSSVYHRTSRFPNHELYGLTNQLRRAAVSVAANISEGSGRLNSKEFRHFLKISNGSLNELETLLIISFRLGYLEEIDHIFFQEKIRLITSQLCGLVRSLDRIVQSDNSLK